MHEFHSEVCPHCAECRHYEEERARARAHEDDTKPDTAFNFDELELDDEGFPF